MKADIYYQGNIIKTVDYDKMHVEQGTTVLLVKTNCNDRVVACVPSDHLIIAKDD